MVYIKQYSLTTLYLLTLEISKYIVLQVVRNSKKDFRKILTFSFSNLCFYSLSLTTIYSRDS